MRRHLTIPDGKTGEPSKKTTTLHIPVAPDQNHRVWESIITLSYQYFQIWKAPDVIRGFLFTGGCRACSLRL